MFTYKSDRDAEGFTVLHFAGLEPEITANAAAHTIRRFGPVDSYRRTVDWAPARSFSAPTNFAAVVSQRGGEWTVNTNAPDELLSTILLSIGDEYPVPSVGETFAGRAERARKIDAENRAYAQRAAERNTRIVKRWFRNKQQWSGEVTNPPCHTPWFRTEAGAEKALARLVATIATADTQITRTVVS